MNNRGISLIELIICLAITSIVLSILAVYISGASQVFRKTNDEVNLQMEAQVTINQLSNRAMEAKKIDLPTDPSDPKRRYVIEGYSESNVYVVIFNKEDNELYLTKATSLAEAQSITSNDDSLLSEYLEDIQITEEDSKTVTITLSFQAGKENYLVSRKIKLRNA